MRFILASVLLAVGVSAYAAPKGCAGNRVWNDRNADGIQQRTEPGISGVTVELLTRAGQPIDATITQSRGYFYVCGPAGRGVIRVTIPSEYRATARAQGSSRIVDSDINMAGYAAVTIVNGKNATSSDVGLVSKSVTGGWSTSPSITAPSAPAPTPEPTPPNAGGGGGGGSSNDLRYGVWVEGRNAMPYSVERGITPAFPNFDFAHVRAMVLGAVKGDRSHPEYVVNLVREARNTNTVLDLKLGSSGEYGWNFDTERGNFSLRHWKNAVSRFAAEPEANQAIISGLADGTIRYIFLIDEPHHSRWAPGWDGVGGSTGNVNYITNEMLDSMAAHVKRYWGNDVKTIVRSAPVRLVQSRRGGMYRFNHLTHAYISPTPKKWIPGNAGAGRGFEWWLRQKNNHTNSLTNCNAFPATNLKMAVMLQWAHESKGNPYTGEKNWASDWWAGNIRYPFRGQTGFVRAAPLEMDFLAKHFMIKRDPATCRPSNDGEVLVDSIVSFRWDRESSDNGNYAMSSYPHYVDFHEQFLEDVRSGNAVPRIGIPVGVGAY